MFGKNKLNLYEIKLDGVEYWKKVFTMEDYELAFIKQKCIPFSLYVDKLGNPKSMPKINGSYYIELITGILLSIEEKDDHIIINPSGVKVPKENFIRLGNDIEKASHEFIKDSFNYSNIAEDVIVFSHYCNIISKDNAIDVVPYKLVEQTFNQQKGAEERESYFNSFAHPNFTAFDFMSLFCYTNASKEKYIINRDLLISFIIYCKKYNLFSNLLEGIKLKNNGIFSYSEELDEAISKLKLSDILYTTSPESNPNVYLYENIDMSILLNKREDYLEEMNNFINQYNDYINNLPLEEKKRIL